MTATAKVFIAYLLLALFVFAWMFRLDVKPVSSASASQITEINWTVTDRWTGAIYNCGVVGGYFKVYPR